MLFFFQHSTNNGCANHTQVHNIHETCHTMYLFTLLKFIHVINVEQSHATYIN